MRFSPGDLFREFLIFGVKQAMACVFAGSFFLLLILSRWISVPGLPRYDVLFLGALAIQALLIATRRETWREVAILSLFHAIGMGLELFKTAPGIGSWSYPEAAFFRLGTVPLYSGFMYAAVASYMIQAWRLLDLRLTGFPSWRVSLVLAALATAISSATTMSWTCAGCWPPSCSGSSVAPSCISRSACANAACR